MYPHRLSDILALKRRFTVTAATAAPTCRTTSAIFVSAAGTFFTVMITIGTSRSKFPFDIFFYCLICLSTDTGKQLNSLFCERCLRTLANASANHCRNRLFMQKICQSTVTLSICFYNFR